MITPVNERRIIKEWGYKYWATTEFLLALLQHLVDVAVMGISLAGREAEHEFAVVLAIEVEFLAHIFAEMKE